MEDLQQMGAKEVQALPQLELLPQVVGAQELQEQPVALKVPAPHWAQLRLGL